MITEDEYIDLLADPAGPHVQALRSISELQSHILVREARERDAVRRLFMALPRTKWGQTDAETADIARTLSLEQVVQLTLRHITELEAERDEREVDAILAF